MEGMKLAARKPVRPSVIIIGAGMSGISAAKTLSDAGIKDFLILEATDRIGGRIRQFNFSGINIEVGANWVEGVNGEQDNPVWEMVNNKLNLRSFRSDYSKLSENTYKESGGGLYQKSQVEDVLRVQDDVHEKGEELSKSLPSSGKEDVSLLTMQRLQGHVPSTPLEMAMDYCSYDYEFAEPPRVTSLQNTVPLPTFADYGEDVYFVADQRGYVSIVYDLACQFLKTDQTVAVAAAAAATTIADDRLQFNKIVRKIEYNYNGVSITTEDGGNYKADYVLVSVSIGVLQTKLIEFLPNLPESKIRAIYQFNMAVYTKIFVKFPRAFWPQGDGKEFFIYVSERRGYYPIWQQTEKEYPGGNILLVTVTDEESRRIEQQDESRTKAEIVQVMRNMFGEDIPEPTEIHVARWWSDRFFKGSFSNWPIGVNRFEYDHIRAPIGRVHFTGEHTSTRYNGYVHGAYLAGIESAKIMIKSIRDKTFKFTIKPKDA